MPIQKLVIEIYYVNDKPLYPVQRFKMEQAKYHSAIAWDSLIQFLTMYSREGIITPIYPEGSRSTITEITPKCKRTRKAENNP